MIEFNTQTQVSIIIIVVVVTILLMGELRFRGYKEIAWDYNSMR